MWSIATATAAVLTALSCFAGTAAASAPKLHPIDGAHWQAGAGMADRTGDARQAIVYGRHRGLLGPPDAHTAIIRFEGVAGMPVAELAGIGFAVGDDRATLDPCVRVAYTTPEGRGGELMIHVEDMRPVASGDTGFTRYAYGGPLPQGNVTAITVEVQPEDATLPSNSPLRLDDVAINHDHVWSSAADNDA